MFSGILSPSRLRPNIEGTEYTRQMLYWECRGLRYYAGQIGTPSPAPNEAQRNADLVSDPSIRGPARGDTHTLAVGNAVERQGDLRGRPS